MDLVWRDNLQSCSSWWARQRVPLLPQCHSRAITLSLEMEELGTISVCSLVSGNHPRAASHPETSPLHREGKTPFPLSLTFCISMQLLKPVFRFYPKRCRVLFGGECGRLELANLGSVPSPATDVLCGLWQWLTSVSQFIVFFSLKCCAVECRAEHCCLSSAVREHEGGRR